MISYGIRSHKGWKEIGHTIILSLLLYLQMHQLCVLYCMRTHIQPGLQTSSQCTSYVVQAFLVVREGKEAGSNVTSK